MSAGRKHGNDVRGKGGASRHGDSHGSVEAVWTLHKFAPAGGDTPPPELTRFRPARDFEIIEAVPVGLDAKGYLVAL